MFVVCDEAVFVNTIAFVLQSGGLQVTAQRQSRNFLLHEMFTAGWSICLLGYFCAYILGAVHEALLTVVYNVADFVNKLPSCSTLV